MISDHELVLAAAATYSSTDTPYFEDVDRAIRVFLSKASDGANIIAIEGTHDPLGWALDFFALQVQDQQGMDHKTLGFVHAGFYAAAVSALPRIVLAASGAPFYITGHSLGAGLALEISGMLIDDNLAPLKVGAFAPPRVGGATFVKIATSIPFCAYRFGNDPVPEVPLSLPDFPYVQVPLTQVGEPGENHAPPSIMSRLLSVSKNFADHHISNYVAAVPSPPTGVVV